MVEDGGGVVETDGVCEVEFSCLLGRMERKRMDWVGKRRDDEYCCWEEKGDSVKRVVW